MAEDGFHMEPNTPVDSGAAATIVADAAVGKTEPQGQPDAGKAQAKAKEVDNAEFGKEFGLEGGEKPATGKPADEVEVVVDDEDALLEDGDGKPDKDDVVDDDDPDDTRTDAQKKADADAKVAADAKGGDEPEAIADWLKDVDDDARQEMVEEFFESNTDLTITVQRDGKDVELTLEELKRDAGGYSGEAAVEKKIADARTEIKKRSDELKSREEFLGKQLDKPDDLLAFLDANVSDPLKYYKAIQEHAEAVLKQADEDPAGFRRDTASRRANQARDARLDKLTEMFEKFMSGKGTPKAETADDGEETAAEKVERKAEGKRRVKFVTKELGLKVADVERAWSKAGSPSDFYAWIAKWNHTRGKDTSKRAKKATKTNRRRAGTGLRRRGGSTTASDKPANDGKALTAKGIEEFLVNHPTNKGRLS